MNRWLLKRLDMDPNGVFYNWELKMHCPEFDRMRADGMLIRDLASEKSEYCFTKWGRRLQLARLDGSIFGTDIEDPGRPVVELSPEDIVQYRFNWEPWLKAVRTRNALHGSASRLGKRCFFLGEKTDQDRKLAFVLGLFHGAEQALTHVQSLPARIPSKYRAIVVTTLAFDRLPEEKAASLERLGVCWAPSLDAETLDVSFELDRRGQGIESLPSVLPRDMEEEYRLHGFKCRLPVHITGDTGKSGNNVVLVGESRVLVSDVPFVLFLRLAVGLFKNKGGLVSKLELAGEGNGSEDTEFQSVHRLRRCFVRALGDLNPQDFVEVPRPKTLRLSIHPALVSYDKTKLGAHDNAVVRMLAEQMP